MKLAFFCSENAYQSLWVRKCFISSKDGAKRKRFTSLQNMLSYLIVHEEEQWLNTTSFPGVISYFRSEDAKSSTRQETEINRGPLVGASLPEHQDNISGISWKSL